MAAGGIKPQGEDNSSLDRWQPGRYEKGEPNGWRGRRPDALADHLTGFPSVGMPNHRSTCGFASTELAVLRALIEGGRMTRSTEFRFMVKTRGPTHPKPSAGSCRQLNRPDCRSEYLASPAQDANVEQADIASSMIQRSDGTPCLGRRCGD